MGDGAFLEGRTLHFTSGLVLPVASTFEPPGYPEDAFPLRNPDGFCLNANGEVAEVGIALPGG